MDEYGNAILRQTMDDTESVRVLWRTYKKQVHLLWPSCKTLQETEGQDCEEEIDMCEDHIKVICPICKRELFEGTEKEARRLIIYCPDC